jgi:hypothetical protein
MFMKDPVRRERLHVLLLCSFRWVRQVREIEK